MTGVFVLPTPVENFLPIALKHLSLAELKEAIRPKFYGDIRYKPVGEYVPPVEVPKVAAYSEPAPSTAAPAAADSRSEEEEEEEALQLIISEEEKEELTGTAAAIVRSTTAGIEAAIARSTIVGKPPPPFSRPRGRGRGVRPPEAPPSAKGFGRGILSLEAHQSMVGRGRASSRGTVTCDSDSHVTHVINFLALRIVFQG